MSSKCYYALGSARFRNSMTSSSRSILLHPCPWDGLRTSTPSLYTIRLTIARIHPASTGRRQGFPCVYLRIAFFRVLSARWRRQDIIMREIAWPRVIFLHRITRPVPLFKRCLCMHPLSVFNTAYCLTFNAFKKDGSLQQCAKEVWWIYTEPQEHIWFSEEYLEHANIR